MPFGSLNLCQLASTLSAYVDLDLSASYETPGLTISEEGISHVLVRLMAMADARVITRFKEFDKAEEKKNGADLEVWFTEGGKSVGWRIQAKRTATKVPKSGPNISDLDKEVGKVAPRDRQVDLLIDGTKSGGLPRPLAVYWIYGPTHLPSPPSSSSESVLVARADSVKALLDKKVPGTRWKSWEKFRLVTNSKTLHELWCDATSVPGAPIPTASLLQRLAGRLDVEINDGLPAYLSGPRSQLPARAVIQIPLDSRG